MHESCELVCCRFDFRVRSVVAELHVSGVEFINLVRAHTCDFFRAVGVHNVLGFEGTYPDDRSNKLRSKSDDLRGESKLQTLVGLRLLKTLQFGGAPLHATGDTCGLDNEFGT